MSGERVPELEFDQTVILAAEAGHDPLVGDAGADWVVDPVPAYVERDLRKFLECGILAHGFAGAESVILRAFATTERRLVCAQCIRGKLGAAPAFAPAR